MSLESVGVIPPQFELVQFYTAVEIDALGECHSVVFVTPRRALPRKHVPAGVRSTVEQQSTRGNRVLLEMTTTTEDVRTVRSKIRVCA
jgi:hypothetical protein